MVGVESMLYLCGFASSNGVIKRREVAEETVPPRKLYLSQPLGFCVVPAYPGHARRIALGQGHILLIFESRDRPEIRQPIVCPIVVYVIDLHRPFAMYD
jgi:hypothetical protein